MQLARQQLLALRNELFGIEETAEEMSQIMDHVNALQDILSTAKETVGLSRFLTLLIMSDRHRKTCIRVRRKAGPVGSGNRDKILANRQICPRPTLYGTRSRTN